MKSLFEFDNYREYLKYYVSRKEAPRGLRTVLSKAMGCQAAYFTQVLNEAAELTEDHAFRLVRQLQFNQLESEYFTLLVRMSRASSHDLKIHLKAESQKLIKKSLEVHTRIPSDKLKDNEEFTREYFSSWEHCTLHIATSAEKYQSITSLARRLNLTEERVLKVLQSLEQKQLVTKDKSDKWGFAGSPLHLKKESPLFTNYQIQQRFQAIKALQKSNPENLHFSSVFTLDKESMQEVKKMLLASIEKTHKKIHAGGTDEIYGICLDLFEVI